MSDTEARMIRESVEAWGRATVELERERRERIRATVTVRDLSAFAGLATFALTRTPAPATSGLVVQQEWFQMLRARMSA